MVVFNKSFTQLNEGGCNYDSATAFIRQQFEGLNKSDTKQVYTHFTCATDTNNIKFIFNAVRDIILQTILRQSSKITTLRGKNALICIAESL